MTKLELIEATHSRATLLLDGIGFLEINQYRFGPAWSKSATGEWNDWLRQNAQRKGTLAPSYVRIGTE